MIFVSTKQSSQYNSFPIEFYPENVEKLRTDVETLEEIVGNKTKGRISKRVLRENKIRPIFRKTRT